LLYAQLRLLNLISTKDLQEFRQMDSLTPGHPEYLHTKGVESTTGPLGQGIATAVGIAMAEAHLASKFEEIDHYTYVLCGDGDLEEGVANEALSLAGRQKLNKLIILHDSNDIQLDTDVAKTFNENIKNKMIALNFEHILVKENTPEKIDLALKKAKKSTKPTFIQIKTTIGDGAPGQGTTKVHGAPLGVGINELRKNLK
jgi:transketolase